MAKVIAFVALGAMLAASCGDDNVDSSSDTSVAPTTTAPATPSETSSTSTEPPAPATDPVEIRRATAIRDLPRADPRAPALLVTPGANIPNPFVLVDEGRYHMFSSQIGWYDPNVEYRVSDSIFEWPVTLVGVLPVIPTWATGGFTWAPDVRRIGDRYILYMTTRQPEPEIQCIGTATADTPEGPYEPIHEQLVCQVERGGSIDARTFVDENGALWLHWKSDDNSNVGGSELTSIYAQPLSEDGLTRVGEPVRILEVDQPWEGRIVEAPQMVLLEEEHWLFYSGNWFNQPAYSIGVARCEGPAGPCAKPFDVPLVVTNDQGAGPGEQSLFVDLDGRLWMIYSPVAQEFRDPTNRPVAMARIGLDDNGPYLADPSAE